MKKPISKQLQATKAEDFYKSVLEHGNGTYVSNCCGADILMETFCGDCKEHCSPEYEPSDEEYEEMRKEEEISRRDYEQSQI